MIDDLLATLSRSTQGDQWIPLSKVVTAFALMAAFIRCRNDSISSTQSSTSRKAPSDFLVIFYSEDFSIMKYVEKKYLVAEAGALMNRRDMSIYDGKPFECACGQTHEFYDHLNLGNFASTGFNAKMIVKCSLGTDAATVIKTKYKYLFMFDCFISLAGYKPTGEQ